MLHALVLQIIFSHGLGLSQDTDTRICDGTSLPQLSLSKFKSDNHPSPMQALLLQVVRALAALPRACAIFTWAHGRREHV